MTSTAITDMFSTISTTMNIQDFHHAVLWILIFGFIFAFFLGFGMGANDVANSFGTSVGAKVLTLPWAYLLASIFNTLGAVFVGYNVTDTMRKGVIDIDLYIHHSTPKLFLAGQVAVLFGSSAWVIIASILKLPISTTHSIVGATLGFSICLKGFDGVQWAKVIKIVASWFISPILSGVISGTLYLLVDITVLRRKNPVRAGLIGLPIFYFIVIAFNTFAVIYQGSKVLHLHKIKLWIAIVISLSLATLVFLFIQFIGKRLIIRWINNMKLPQISNAPQTTLDSSSISPDDTTPNDDIPKTKLPSYDVENSVYPEKKDSNSCMSTIQRILPDKKRVEDSKTLKLFAVLQVFTACFMGFAHGANDVSNCIAPLSAIWLVYKKGEISAVDDETPILILLYGVAGICTGLTILGHRVIQTVGKNMTEVHPASGFTIEFGAALTVLLASKLGIPVSTTHCLVGSVVFVGIIKSGRGIDWRLFGNIAMSWLVTLPVAGVISAGVIGLMHIWIK